MCTLEKTTNIGLRLQLTLLCRGIWVRITPRARLRTFLSSHAGRSGKPLSTPSVTKHLEGQDEDDDEDEDAQDSLFDALLAADRARYEAEHMKLAVYVDAHLHLPAAVEARLARHVAELIDERAEIDAVLELSLIHI